MRTSSRVVASALGLALTLTACSGGQPGSLLPPSSPSNAGGPMAGTNLRATMNPSSEAPLATAPKTFGALAFSDLGRRDPHAMVRVALTLRYEHQAELDRFTDEAATTHHFLTREQFIARFAPSQAHEEAVVAALRNAGFTIERRYPNRTLVDAKAPSTVVERFFSTEMHNVHQGKYGVRYTNVKDASVPESIRPLVRAVSLNNLIVAQTVVDQSGGPINPHPTGKLPQKTAKPPTTELPAAFRPMATGCSGQLFVNPGFESGATGWTTSGDVWDYAPYAYQGSYFAWLDGYSYPGGADYDAQTVSIPAGCKATLSYELYIDTNESSYSGAIDTLKVTVNGTTVQSFSNLNATSSYTLKTVDVSKYAGGNATIQWSSYHGGYGTSDFLLDNTSLTLSPGTGTPPPSPTPAPTATPTAKPTATPTTSPTATPTAHPTATPTTAPTATPTTAPTATPAAGCNNAASLNGPLSNSSGTLATGVSKPFDFPSQHGCTGAGETAAIVIDLPGTVSYVNSYLSGAGVTQTGTITFKAVDGGGSGDEAEADLDMETIAGLAPQANIIVYDTGSLSDQAIEDAYNQVLTDGKAQVVNSSFGGCESGDTPFASSTNSIAQQGASTGVTFNASSGDHGSNNCGSTYSPSEGVSAPAGGAYFQSIGGVNFTYNSSGVLQTVTAGTSNGDAGGGGVSTVNALPSYQSGITGTITSGRNQPDISLPFDPVAVYTGGSWGSYLGTSWSSPASVALILQADQLHGSKLGQLNPTLYSLFKSSGYNTYYTPCTSGSIGAYSCNGSQYNQAAGIGAPKGWALANAL